MDAFHVADKSNQKLKAKLTEEEREREREREREKKKVLQLPWTALKNKQKAKEYCFAMLRTNWPPSRSRSLL